MIHEFTIIVSGLEYSEDTANIFYEAGCDDAALSFQEGIMCLDFSRESETLLGAVISAITEVSSTGVIIENIYT